MTELTYNYGYAQQVRAESRTVRFGAIIASLHVEWRPRVQRSGLRVRHGVSWVVPSLSIITLLPIAGRLPLWRPNGSLSPTAQSVMLCDVPRIRCHVCALPRPTLPCPVPTRPQTSRSGLKWGMQCHCGAPNCVGNLM